VYVKRHNYVSFAATGNKFRRFAREIARVKGTGGRRDDAEGRRSGCRPGGGRGTSAT